VKHAVQRGILVPTQHLLWDQGKPRKTLIESDYLDKMLLYTYCDIDSGLKSREYGRRDPSRRPRGTLYM
jgi:hypothetical protein